MGRPKGSKNKPKEPPISTETPLLPDPDTSSNFVSTFPPEAVQAPIQAQWGIPYGHYDPYFAHMGPVMGLEATATDVYGQPSSYNPPSTPASSNADTMASSGDDETDGGNYPGWVDPIRRQAEAMAWVAGGFTGPTPALLEASETTKKPKDPPKKKGRPPRGQKREQGGSDAEIDTLPETERQKAGLKIDSSETAEVLGKSPRWTTAQQGLAVDYIVSAEVWPTWKENMPHHLEKIATGVLKETKTVEQVCSWWTRTWDRYLTVKEQRKHTGGGDGDDGSDGTSTSGSEVEVDKVTGKKTRKRVNAREMFSKSYVFDQIDHVAYDLPQVARPHTYSSAAPSKESKKRADDTADKDTAHPKKKLKRSASDADTAAEIVEMIKEVATRGQARLQLDQEKLKLEKEKDERKKKKEEREKKREAAEEECRLVEDKRRVLFQHQDMLLQEQKTLMDVMKAGDDEMKEDAKKEYKLLAQELKMVKEELGRY